MLNARQRIFLAFLVAGALVSLLAWVVFLPNDARAQAQPALNLTVAPTTVSERNGTATITVAITNSVVFATDQVIALSFAGTAIPSDFTVEDASNFALTSPYQLILAAGATSVTGTIKPVDDDVYEGDETIEVAASLGGTAIGSAQTVTVTDEADRARVTLMARVGDPHLDADVVDLWPFQVLVVFDRDVRGLEPHEIAITNGRALSVRPQQSGNRSRYVVTIQATGTSGEELRVHVPENVVDDGNAPSASSVDYRGTITGDDVELISMTTSASQPATELFPVVLTFSADVCWDRETAEALICAGRPPSQHLQAHHFVVTGGSISAFIGGAGLYLPDEQIHLDVTPDADFEGKMVLVLPEYAAATASGGRTGGGRLEVEVDTLGPELLSASVTGDGLTLSYHEFLGQVPPTSALTVTVAGTAVSVTRITLNGAALILELDQSVTTGQETLVSYTKLGAGIEDEHGNLALGVSDFEADTGAGSRAPSLSSAEIRGSVLTLNFDEPLYPFSQPDQGDFTVAVAGSAAVIHAASLSGVSVIITMANEVQAGQVVLVSYTPGSSPIEDFGNTPAAAFSGESVTNATPVTIPVLSSAAVVGETLTMRYSEALDEGSTPAAADFEVSIEGARVVVNSVAVSGTDVTLGLGQMVAFGDEVLLDYTRGTSPIRDIGGTDAASFVDGRVRNATPDPGPVLVSAVLEDATLTLTYTEPLDTTSVPDKDDFHVQYVGFGSGTLIDSVAVSGTTVVVHLDSGVPLPGTPVELDYTPGAMPIQDEAANPAAALVDQEVAVDTVPVRVTFVRGSITLAEGASTSVTLTLDRDPEREVVIPLTESPGTGALTGDFSGVPASVTFISGQTARNFTFSATEDTESEGPEIVDIELGTLPDWVSSGLQDTSRITIADNDPAAKVTGVTVTELNKRLTIDWAATPHATGYKVQWKSRSQTFADAATDNRKATIRSGSTTTYVIAGLTNGLEYTVRVIATKTGVPEGIPSDEVKGTPVFSNIAPTGQPAISGVPEVGQTLTVSVSGIVDGDGLSNVDYAYQWVRVDGADETEIAGATNRTYRLQTIDEGKRIRVDVSFVDDNGTEETLSSPVFPTSGTIGPGMPTAHTLVANSDGPLGDQGQHIIRAQSFRTGANSGGYTITGIGLRLVSVAGVDPEAGHASLRENARVMQGGVRTSVPGVLISNLANPPSFSDRNALNTFAAPANIVLKRNTTYWVTLNEAAGDAGPSPAGTFDNREDSGSRPGWEIGDGSLTKFETDTVLWGSGNSSLSLRITGYENAGLSALGLTDPTDSNVGFGLAPAFNGAITSYTAAVANDVASVKLTATAGKANDVVVITDDDDTNSPVEAVLDLVVGTNSLIVTVTAVDGIATRTYEIEVTRLPEPPAQVTGVMVTPGSGQLQVQWDPVSGATGYRVQWKSGGETFADAATENREVTVSPGSMTEYTITGLANGTEYTVRVMATKTGAVDGMPSSEITGTPVNLQSTGKPTISGDAMVGETLSADTSGIMDAEGLTGAVYQYQWIRVDSGTETDIPGATGAAYRLRNPDANKEVKVRVSYEDDAGNEETVTSDAYPDSGILLGRVLVSNFEQAQSSSQLFMGEHVGNRYTQSQGFETGGHAAGYVMTNAGFVTSSWTAGADTRLRIFSESSDEPDALVHTMGERIPLAYNRDGRQAFVAPASAELEKDTTYFAVMDVTAAASFTNLTTAQSTDEDGDGATGWSIDNGSLFQDPPVGDSWDQWHAGSNIAKVAVWGFPKNTAATGKPAISGTATVGETLTASPGNIADTNGLTDDPSYVYRWIRRSSGTDTDIPGATGSTYQLTLADVGNQVKVQVAFVDDLLHEESRTSNAYPAGTSRIGAASSDTTLSALSIEDDGGSLTLVPPFDPATATYTADADRETTRVTIETTPNDSDATIAYYPSSDADGGSDGHQVDLNFGGNELRVVVTAADTFTTQTYTVTVTRELPELSFENTEYTASEGSGEIIVAVVLSHASTQTVTVGYETQDATATAGEEYTATSGTLTFAPGTMTQNITIPVGDDNVDEHNKVFRVYLVNPSGATLPSANYFASVEVQDDEAAPTATLADVSADESAGTLTLTLMLTHASESDIRYRLADGDVGGTASEPGDYRYDRNRTSTSAQITVPGGDLSSTFDMTVVDDDLPEDDETIVMRWERVGAGATPNHLNVTATITDNDDPERLVLLGSLLSVGEAGLNTFTVELATQPTHDVSVAVTSGDTGAATVSPTPLAFTTGDWDTVQTVTVSGVDDSDDRDETVTITLTASSTDAGYEGKTGAVSVSVADDDTAGLVLSRSSLTMGEAGSDSFTVKLGTRPASPVSLVVQSNDAAAAKVDDPQTLTINAGAWNTEQTVTVSGVDDADYNDENVTVTITATSGDAKYNLLTAPVSVIVEDDEVVPVAVNFERASYTVGEAGNVTVTVKLSADPERTVTITITRANQGATSDSDYSGVPMNVTFNSGDTENAFTFSATQDGVDDDGESVKLGFGSTLPTGVTAGSPSETTVTITDDDTAGVSVSETALTVVEEDGTGDSYTVVLDTEPTADVTVTVAGHAGTDASLDKTTLTFTSLNWSTAQTVTVTAGEDGDADDETDVTLSHAVASADANYNGIVAGSVTVSINDNDTDGVTVSETDLTIVEGNTDSYTVVLDTQPAGNVTVTVSGHAGTDASLDQTTLTFTTTTWSTAQVVTVTAGEDGDADDETDVTLSHAVASTDDAAYNGISAGSVVVSITDNDTEGVTVSETGLTILEGNTDSYTVVPRYPAHGGCRGDGGRAFGHGRYAQPDHADFHHDGLGDGADGDGDRRRRCGHGGRCGGADPQRGEHGRRLQRAHDRRSGGDGDRQRHGAGDGGDGRSGQCAAGGDLDGGG